MRGRVLVISYGEFSGIRRSLLTALSRQGCEIVEVAHSLRYLRFRPLYLALMILNALLVYGWRFRTYLNRTWAAQWARGRANDRAVARHENIDAVISLNMMPSHVRRVPGVIYAIFTDHVNLLSKQGPTYGLDPPERRVSSAWNRYERRVLNSQDHVFVSSAYVKRSVVDDYGVDPSRVHVVGAGANLDVDCECDGIEKDYAGRNVLFVGLDPIRKGLPTLLRAFGRVAAEFPDARLNVVGVQGADSDNVRYHGRLSGDALKAQFYGAQVFAMPSLREPFGIVFLEAMRSKAVCIGTNAFAMPEFIEHGVSGFLVSPGDERALADRIIELFCDPQRLRCMADTGYRAARARWTWDKVARRILRTTLADVDWPEPARVAMNPARPSSTSDTMSSSA